MNPLRLFSFLFLLAVSFPAAAEDGVLLKLQSEIQALARDAGPSVVKISVERKGHADLAAILQGRGFSVESLINRSSMVGTGFIIDEEGLILTTNQLADTEGPVQVRFSDGTIREGEVIGRDEFFKVALLRVKPVEGMKALELAPSEEVPFGSLGILMGNSFGVSGNMSLGIITGARRSGVPGDAYDNYLLLNTPILPGDAGGPFLDPQGRVVGMGVIPYSGVFRMVGGGAAGQGLGNSLIPTGMGCLIPASDLRYAVEEIKAHGWVRKGRLGVLVNRGSLDVREVLEGTPASDAGLEPGDKFLTFADRMLRSGADLFHALRRTEVGRSVSLDLSRNGKTLRVSIRVDLAPPKPSDLLRLVQIDDDGNAVVFRVDAGFDRMGVCCGDRILSINGREIEAPLMLLKELVLRQDAGPIRIVLQRGEEQVKITIPR